ncbi:hypothetical protein SDC9_165558 [bioreactor metagenome]|uniref:Uncharacterized protein n=1 Tax=bioreactor metagenome TaxID=1076179 RepID=A0A645FX61_9ZZZZ
MRRRPQEGFAAAPKKRAILKAGVFYAVYRADMGSDKDPAASQQLLGNRPREDQRRGEPPRKLAAAAHVREAAVARRGGVVGVSRARKTFQQRIVA